MPDFDEHYYRLVEALTLRFLEGTIASGKGDPQHASAMTVMGGQRTITKRKISIHMRMSRKVSYALVAAGITLSTPVMAASPATAAVRCSLDGVNHLFGRTVNSWNCRGVNEVVGRGHGQILHATPGDSVEMQYFSVKIHRYVSAGRRYVGPGSTTASSGELLPEQMLGQRACIRVASQRFAVACTPV